MINFRAKAWVNPFEKMSFFDYFNFLSLLPRNALFRSRISKNKFPWPILSEKKGWKNDNF